MSAPVEAVAVEVAPPSPAREFWRYFSANPGAVAGLAVIALIAVVAALADLIAPHSPTENHVDAFLKPPAWEDGGSWTYVLGTDSIGRDILSRIMHGTRFSLLIGCIVVAISLASGTALGVLSGYLKGSFEILVMRLMDVLLTIPNLLLAIVLVAILGTGLTNAMIAVAITYLPQFVRITRAAFIAEMAKDYVVASRVNGAGAMRLMFLIILPNCMAPLIVQATLSFSTAILDAAALGFLSLGAQPPTPEWGTMLADSRDLIQSAWWAVTFPGIAILIAVLAFNLMGDGLRDALDPRLRR